MTASSLAARVHSRIQRDSARFLFRRLVTLHNRIPIISFTFDDFPSSALRTGGAILKRYGVRGTYYASLGLMGTVAPTGAICVKQDIDELLAQGHELGCHTFSHCDSWATDSKTFERSILENRDALANSWPAITFKTFSYPISPPRPANKLVVARQFDCCRGGGQTFNTGSADLNYLSAYFMEQARGAVNDMKAMIDANQHDKGWLIFATHDVSDSHTPFGCTPALFKEIVRYSVESGARVLPVGDALREVAASLA